MTYTLIPETERGYLLVLATFVLIIYIYCIIRMLDAGRKNLQFACTCAISAVAFALYQGMVMYQQEDLDSYDVPVPVLVGAFVVFLIFGAYMLYNIVDWQKTNISAMSVKEAFDRLPTGLAYYTLSGVPIMVNEAMQQLSRKVFDETVTDANAFWEKIKAYDGNDAVRDDNNVIVNA
ncbi:MAG: FUSC family protein, partial [Lachnospiraceae bacterium]|nr:FUSC family protein [Lachnospiraceae bacterium]